jgi:predicted metal-dependent HD superfamily phosphohydrolase
MTVLSQDRWTALCTAAGASGDSAPLYHQLRAAYSEPHRRYHNLRHIAECLNELDPVRGLVQAPNAVELAVWFHDAVYDTHAADNEERSAALARSELQKLGAGEVLISTIERLVLATKRHDVSLDNDAPTLVDVDLSILGQSPERFLEYERQIREEYGWVPQQTFCEKRAEILKSFLARKRIFSTEWFFNRYEVRARANLALSVAALSAGRLP